MNEQKQFTVFTEYGVHQGNDYPQWRNLPLKDFIDAIAKEFSEHVWVAWAPEYIEAEGGAKPLKYLRAESIAAGRIIEKVDGRYIARGVPTWPWTQPKEEDKPLFTLGKTYRTRDGSVTAVYHGEADPYNTNLVLFKEGEKGHWRKRDGFYFGDVQCPYDFLPEEVAQQEEKPLFRVGGFYRKGIGQGLISGELQLKDGQLVAVETKEEAREVTWTEAMQEVAEFVARNTDPNAAMIARDGPAKPAVAAVVQESKPTAKPALSGLTRVTDLSTHQIPAGFGSALIR